MNSIHPKVRSTAARRVTALATAAALVALSGCATVVRLSQSAAKVEGNSASRAATLNFDGRWVAFESWASNLTANDHNGTVDVVVRDQQSEIVELVSANPLGQSANAASDQPSVSDDGNRIAFRSAASDLVGAPSAAPTDVYVRDRAAGTTTRVSVTSDGTAANGESSDPRISGDGRYVAFSSAADNLAANDTNNRSDVFVHDLVSATTSAVSVTTNGTVGGGTSTEPAISQDGRYVTFTSTTSNLVPGDGNGGSDVFRRDRTIGTTSRVSVTTSGIEAARGSSASAISADGQVIVFESTATNLIANDVNDSTDVFVRNLNTFTTNMVSVDSGSVPGDGSSHTATLSADGRYVAFVSWAQLVPDDENYGDDIYVRDRLKAKTRRVSTMLFGGEVHDPNEKPSLSGDGRSVAFQSSSPDLVGGDNNHVEDIFMKPVTVPNVVSTSPGSIARGTGTTLTLNGTGFLPGTTVLIPVPGITVGAATILSENQLTVPVTVAAGATTGTAVMWVVLPGTGAGAGVSSMTLCPCIAVT